MNAKASLRAVVIVAIGFVVWTILNRLVFDPQFAAFLAHKTDLARPLRLTAWLRVLDVHIAFACLALLAGALNFAGRPPSERRTRHRAAGYLYLASVLIVVATSGYMAPYATGGRAVSMAFNLLNMLWIAVTLAALVTIRRKQVDRHRRWMIRSYAFCFTNLSIHLIETVLTRTFGMPYKTAYAVSVYVTILLLAAIAEWVVRRTVPNRQRTETSALH
ncbi:DUF2306 domain-containing protein [Cohnella rhizosphaerae]|uniref:DUF2306 domain-containing protein n=1 Tax=Cohnella rhizosphaerae TaxID=1457232 RepID=A0A9X4KVB2_9BACL|nr:DUF2306 domain-containing protein [Cohnella rhizosphaerae]MDG0811383.1 DUF2306 domain-containing protein [Cohnella rhizosphaerae]